MSGAVDLGLFLLLKTMTMALTFYTLPYTLTFYRDRYYESQE